MWSVDCIFYHDCTTRLQTGSYFTICRTTFLMMALANSQFRNAIKWPECEWIWDCWVTTVHYAARKCARRTLEPYTLTIRGKQRAKQPNRAGQCVFILSLNTTQIHYLLKKKLPSAIRKVMLLLDTYTHKKKTKWRKNANNFFSVCLL